MKRYFTTLVLSTLMSCPYTWAAGVFENSESSVLPESHVASPMIGQSAKVTPLEASPDNHVTECFRIYTPERKPGINCVPDASTGH